MNPRGGNGDEPKPRVTAPQEARLTVRTGQGVVKLLSAQHSVPPTKSVVGHWVDALKERIRLRIDERATRTASKVLQTHIDHLNLLHQYHGATRKFQTEEMERQVKEAELEQRMEGILIERRLSRHLERARLRRDEAALAAEVAKLQSEIRTALAPAKAELTPGQQRAVKKAETDDAIQRLETEEAQAVQRTNGELERRRVKNMYANRREQLMEELEKYL